MLKIVVPPIEYWDSEKEEFIYDGTDQELLLEHSLISISKWESKWHKPFLSKFDGEKTDEELLDYVRCMTINKVNDSTVYDRLTISNLADIKAYLQNPMTATTIAENGISSGGVIPTSEVIYSWMVEYRIPFECEKWHINRLITLIRVCNEKQKPEKKQSTAEILRSNAALNAARLKKYNTKG